MKLHVAALATLLALTGCAGDPQEASSGGERERAVDRATASADPDDAATPKPSESSHGEAGGGGSTTVPLYFVGDTERAGPRLYREFQRVEGDPLVAAAARLTAGEVADPDYRTLFPGGSFADVAYDDGTIVVTVADDGWHTRAAGMSVLEARLAVQQLVHTLQGVQQERAPVEVRNQDGGAVPLFGIDTAAGLRQASPLQVLSHVNLTSPEQGAAVSGGTLRVTGVGNSVEANVGWEIRQGDRVVRDGFATAEGWLGDRLFPFETSVDVAGLEPGSYTLRVTTDDPTGDAEGVGAMTDDKEFTVR